MQDELGVSVSGDPFSLGGHVFSSRLIAGTGKYGSFALMRDALCASGCEIVTVAVRLIDLDRPGEEIVSFIPDGRLLLPNTAGARTAEEAVRVSRLTRAGGLPAWAKLEVIPDSRYLLPDPVGTLQAAETLVADGFTVLPYMFPDPVLARQLEEVGCAAVMPLAAPIGTGRGMRLAEPIGIIVEQAGVPVIVDAGLGAPSHAAAAMELGADAVLVNTAIARATDPVAMAAAFRLATQAGRAGFLAGVMARRESAEPSSPLTGLLGEA